MMPEAVARCLSGRRPWSIGGIAITVGAITWVGGLSTWQALAIALATLSTGVLMVSRIPRRARGASPAPGAASAPLPAGNVDPDEVFMQDATSGRVWRLGDVHFMAAAEKRRLAAERPHVWKAYRARLFPFPEASSQRRADDRAP